MVQMVYLDNNASTPVDPRVVELVEDVQRTHYGNPSSSSHPTGLSAAEIVEQARNRVADATGSHRQSVIFTSGATEAIGLALLGLAMRAPKGRRDFVIVATEHKAVFASAQIAARITGGEVKVARVDADGTVDLDHLRSITDHSVLATATMLANNEVGTVNPVEQAAAIAHGSGSLLLCDATQAVGRIPVRQAFAQSDITVLSGHKIYGPKGSGALIADRHTQKLLEPISSGGGQERGLRGGTQNVPAIAGFGLAAQLADKELDSDSEHFYQLTSALASGIANGLRAQGLRAPIFNRARDSCLPNTLNLRFPGADAEAVLASAPRIEASTGSACQSAVDTPSHVLTAIGLDAEQAAQCIRLSVGRFTKPSDISLAVDEIVNAVARVYRLSNGGPPNGA
jgi:cysteine desulfurase